MWRTTTLLMAALVVTACGGTGGAAQAPTEPPGAAAATPAGPAPEAGVSMDAPPPAWLETPSGAHWMAYGTFCWDQGCADTIPPDQLPDVPQVAVDEGGEVTFHLGFDPDEVDLAFPDRDEHRSLSAERQVSWTVSDRGFVVLTAWREEGGDASYIVELTDTTTG